MIEVDVVLNPFGTGLGKKHLAKLLIANVGSSGEYYKYLYRVYEPHPLFGEPINIFGKIEKYDRKSPVMDIVKACLDDYEKGYYKSFVANEYEQSIVEAWNRRINE